MPLWVVLCISCGLAFESGIEGIRIFFIYFLCDNNQHHGHGFTGSTSSSTFQQKCWRIERPRPFPQELVQKLQHCSPLKQLLQRSSLMVHGIWSVLGLNGMAVTEKGVMQNAWTGNRQGRDSFIVIIFISFPLRPSSGISLLMFLWIVKGSSSFIKSQFEGNSVDNALARTRLMDFKWNGTQIRCK